LHQAKVAFELEVLAKKVDRFGWDRDRSTPAHDRLVMDWINALQDFPLGEVQAACVAGVLANPNKMPNEGHVRAEIMRARAKAVAAYTPPAIPEPPRKRVDPDRANDIVRQAGIALHMGATS